MDPKEQQEIKIQYEKQLLNLECEYMKDLVNTNDFYSENVRQFALKYRIAEIDEIYQSKIQKLR